MKFYRDKINIYYKDKIKQNKLSAIYTQYSFVLFFENGKWFNNKNAAYIRYDGYKIFNLNDTFYGFQNDFTKESWRKFCKLKVFL